MSMLTSLTGVRSEAQVAAAIAALPNALPSWRAGAYYGNDTQNGVSAYTTATVAANFLIAQWCPTPAQGATIDRIGAEVTAFVAAKLFGVAVYAPTADRTYPGALITSAIDLSTAANAWVEGTIAATLPGHGVWVVFQNNDATVTYRFVAAAAKLAVMGKPAGGAATAYGSLAVARTYGAFPATFPAGATPSASSPVVNMRAV